MKITKKAVMAYIIGLSALTISTTSFADSAQVLQDTNGNTLKTGQAYGIRPVGIVPKVNITVDNDGYVKLSDHRINCQYAYRLIGDDRVEKRNVRTGERIRFEEWKKGTDGVYRKINKFLKQEGKYIHSSLEEYKYIPGFSVFDPDIYLYEVAQFKLSTLDSLSKIRINTFEDNGSYMWKVPYSSDLGTHFVQLQDKNEKLGITMFEFERANQTSKK
ncbi:hypothetical protein [Bacillus cereus group sp. BfR-BA-01349]|uniref:hypothetical protein n=1 Tax=Bacillus cereus group sp. BfR-BA-01349 TaxID=2920312 RepID=UPI001F59F547